ncbi:MAG TPA: hypothetical protein VGA73_03240, partial [Candidatus Binatia bacterium]
MISKPGASRRSREKQGKRARRDHDPSQIRGFSQAIRGRCRKNVQQIPRRLCSPAWHGRCSFLPTKVHFFFKEVRSMEVNRFFIKSAAIALFTAGVFIGAQSAG